MRFLFGRKRNEGADAPAGPVNAKCANSAAKRASLRKPLLAKTLKPEDIIRPTMGVELSLHVLRSSRETLA